MFLNVIILEYKVKICTYSGIWSKINERKEERINKMDFVDLKKFLMFSFDYTKHNFLIFYKY